MTGVERRKQRLTWEAIGCHEPEPSALENLLRKIVFASVVVFMVAVAATFPTWPPPPQGAQGWPRTSPGPLFFA